MPSKQMKEKPISRRTGRKVTTGWRKSLRKYLKEANIAFPCIVKSIAFATMIT